MSPAPPSLLVGAIREYLKRYHRHELHIDVEPPVDQAFIVANHGFGGIVDLNSLALVCTLDELDLKTAADFAARVEAMMQLRMDELVAGRRPVIG